MVVVRFVVEQIAYDKQRCSKFFHWTRSPLRVQAEIGNCQSCEWLRCEQMSIERNPTDAHIGLLIRTGLNLRLIQHSSRDLFHFSIVDTKFDGSTQLIGWIVVSTSVQNTHDSIIAFIRLGDVFSWLLSFLRFRNLEDNNRVNDHDGMNGAYRFVVDLPSFDATHFQR